MCVCNMYTYIHIYLYKIYDFSGKIHKKLLTGGYGCLQKSRKGLYMTGGKIERETFTV